MWWPSLMTLLSEHQHMDLSAGLGLRRELIAPLTDIDITKSPISFFEIAPENWINLGGRLGKQLRYFTERYPFFCHGLSLSIGSPSPLDTAFLNDLKKFLNYHNILMYSEHLSYCSDHGHLYDLMPIPFTNEAVRYVADRVKQVQDVLERPLILENVSYYSPLSNELEEIHFFNAIVEESGCLMLLDINNVYVNSINHGYSAKDFIDAVPIEKVAYYHVAGHYDEADDLKVDTHGADVKNEVWQLLDYAYAKIGFRPTLLERDFNIPPIDILMKEVDKINQLSQHYSPIDTKKIEYEK
ncbi:MAG: DUF692 domain-containing protein [Pseudomonadota bacterium]